MKVIKVLNLQYLLFEPNYATKYLFSRYGYFRNKMDFLSTFK